MKTLPAITAEIVREYRREFGRGDFGDTSTFALVEDFIRAALLKVATETVEAVIPWKAPHSITGGDYVEGCSDGWNNCLSEAGKNFKTFINQ